MKKLIVYMLVVLLILSACSSSGTTTVQTREKTETVTLYFADKNAQGLIPESREVMKNTPEAALEALLSGTENENSIEIIGENTQLLSFENKNGDVTVDFSKEFLESYTDTLVIYSVVNTITEFPGINFVSITIEGKEDVQLGNYLLSEKFTRNNSIIIN